MDAVEKLYISIFFSVLCIFYVFVNMVRLISKNVTLIYLKPCNEKQLIHWFWGQKWKQESSLAVPGTPGIARLLFYIFLQLSPADFSPAVIDADQNRKNDYQH